MPFEKFENTDEDPPEETIEHDYFCWLCGAEWSGYGSHCPECGEPYPE